MAVIDFALYKDAFRTIKLERTSDGILLVRLHRDDGPFVWDKVSHEELAGALRNIARDAENRVVILTGTGNEFSGPPAPPTAPTTSLREDIGHWDHLQFLENHMAEDLLDISAPMISCINGPAYRHAEIPFTADIVLAADDALIQDSAHFPNRKVPGDGIALIFPLLMGWNRARYFHLMGQKITATELKAMGLVSEVMPRDRLLPRAREIAEQFIQNNPLVLRYTRLLFTRSLKAQLRQDLSYGLALEAYAAVDELSR